MISRVRSRINGLVENWTESVMWILCVSTPHEFNFGLSMNTLEKKMKRNKLSCVLLFWNTVFMRTCPVVHVLYIWCRHPGTENRDSTSLKNVLNEIVVKAPGAGSTWVTGRDMSQSEKKKLKNLRKFRDGHPKFV